LTLESRTHFTHTLRREGGREGGRDALVGDGDLMCSVLFFVSPRRVVILILYEIKKGGMCLCCRSRVRLTYTWRRKEGREGGREGGRACFEQQGLVKRRELCFTYIC